MPCMVKQANKVSINPACLLRPGCAGRRVPPFGRAPFFAPKTRRVLAALLAVCLLVWGLPVPAEAAYDGAYAGFTDVSEGDWFALPVQYVKENGYMRGETETEFCPYSTVTRGQLVQVLYNMAGQPPQEGAPPPFADIQGHWAQNAVSWAYGTGISGGLGEGFFGPEDTLTREQAAVLFMRCKAVLAGEEPLPDPNYLNGFIDRVCIHPWADAGMAWAVEAGLLSGKGGGVLDPQGSCTRAELAQLIQNYFQPKEVDGPIQGGVYGVIREAGGSPLPGAQVALIRQDGAQYTTVTDSQGKYWVYGLSTGAYETVATKDGYAQPESVEIYLGLDGAAIRQDFLMEDSLQAKLAVLRRQFPHGWYWNHRGAEAASWDTVTSLPCSHGTGGRWCNAYVSKTAQVFLHGQRAIQCLGFACLISDLLFGRDAPVHTFRDFDKLRVGDHIRLTRVVHSMVVIEKGVDYVKVVEVNQDFNTCMIQWDRKVSKKALEAYGSGVTYVTRYPDWP